MYCKQNMNELFLTCYIKIRKNTNKKKIPALSKYAVCIELESSYNIIYKQ